MLSNVLCLCVLWGGGGGGGGGRDSWSREGRYIDMERRQFRLFILHNVQTGNTSLI